MTHYSTAGQIPIGASSGFNLYAYTPVRKMRRDEIMQVSKDFGKAVRTAHAAGFDCVEVHAGHGYLISQFLSPYTNHRRDEYGGSLDNRMRFMRMCLEEVMNAAAATGTSVLVKHNMYDGFKGGIEIPESIEIAREIERWKVNGIVLSGGFVSKAPMAVMRGLIPIYTMSYYSPLWLRAFIRYCGPFMIRQFPFSECYFLEDAKKFREALQLPLIYVGGLVSREGIERALDSGFELVQMARALVNDPAFVNKLREGDAATRSECDHRNYCIARMYSVDMKCCKHCGDLPRKSGRNWQNYRNDTQGNDRKREPDRSGDGCRQRHRALHGQAAGRTRIPADPRRTRSGETGSRSRRTPRTIRIGGRGHPDRPGTTRSRTRTFRAGTGSRP